MPLTGSIALPAAVRACLFDLDRVITDAATVHGAAWKQTFDAFLAERSHRGGEDREFSPDDPPEAPTIHGIANRKNVLLLHMIETDGVHVFDGSVRFIRLTRSLGMQTAVVSSSANTVEVLRAAGIADLFDTRVDGVVAAERHLAGKPAPDTFLAAAEALSVPASGCSVFEDALAGVAAGRAGRFAYVVGVDRAGQADKMCEAGAVVIVDDLADLILADRSDT